MWSKGFVFACILLQIHLTIADYDPEKCGRSLTASNLVHEKIMGGEDADFGEYPSAVAIFHKGNYECAGTLISTRHVITAAHCFLDRYKTSTIISSKCGDDSKCIHKMLFPPEADTERCHNPPMKKEDILKDTVVYSDVSGCLHGSPKSECNRTRDPQKFTVADVDMSHIQFAASGCHNNDFSILTLDKDIDMTKSGYMCLPQFNKDEISINVGVAKAVGWGYDPIKGVKTHSVLQKLAVGSIMPFAKCKENWGNRFADDQLCVEETNSKDTCEGDSGSSLVLTPHSSNQQQIVGILSMGTPCDNLRQGTQARVAGYTRIDFHFQEIADAIGWKNANFDDLTDIEF